MALDIISHNEEETRKIGFSLAHKLPSGSVILLTGDLGAGKTTLTRGVAEALNITEKITSPTFNIMKIYFKGTKPLIHIDAYRLENSNYDLGMDEFEEEGIMVIEWPEYYKEYLPEDTASKLLLKSTIY